MSSALPTYPDDEIPLTDRHWRERWAAELTRANRVERERDEAVAALTISRKTVEDLTSHSMSQGDYIARLQADVVRQRTAISDSLMRDCQRTDEIARLRACGADAIRGAEIQARLHAYSLLVKAIWDVCYAQRSACLDDVRDALSEVLTNDHLFVNCDVCGGRLWDEDMAECPYCVAGREPR